jgi:hypothetical protein
VLAAFSVLSAIAVWEHGYLGLFAWQLENTAEMQVLADLCIALALVLTWLWSDARKDRQKSVGLGCSHAHSGTFGPFLYLLTSPTRQPIRQETSAPGARGASRLS